MKFLMTTILCSITLLFGACTYDILEEIEKDNVCVTEGMKYSIDIVSIIEEHCLSCHQKESTIGAGIVLDNYNDVRFWVESGSLLSVIQHEQDFPPMPKNADQLTDCDISKITSWIDAGAPNN